MIYSIYLDTSLEHCLKGQKIAKHIYYMKILSNAILNDFAEKQNQKLVDIQTRGGLTKVVDKAQEKHFRNFKCINHFTRNFTIVLSVAHLKITAQTAATYLSHENVFTISLYFKARAD